MNHLELVARLKANYAVLSNLYRNANFEDKVRTTTDLSNESKFYEVSSILINPVIETQSDKSFHRIKGKARKDHDLEWAVHNLELFTNALFSFYFDPHNLPVYLDVITTKTRIEIAFLHLRVSILCYEVEDYFLSVSPAKSKLLVEQSEKIVKNYDDFFASHYDILEFKNNQKAEFAKQILIVALLGANECYRKQIHKTGLKITEKVEKLIHTKYLSIIDEPDSGLGLRGLCHYIAGKIDSYIGKFNRAEEHFRYSVEAYSESLRHKEKLYEQKRLQLVVEIESNPTVIKNQNFVYSKELENIETKKTAIRKLDEDFELTRRMTLRRCGLASSFGHGFQSLVLGNVKEAIRSTSLARAIVHRNAGKIYSAYVNLIYYSAKRAECSSDYSTLKTILEGLENCRRIFDELIPAAHYENRAVFQIALVYHYMAKWWQKEKSNQATLSEKSEEEKNKFKAVCIQNSEKFWNKAAAILVKSIKDLEKNTYSRLRSESLAILAHIQSNLGLITIESADKLQNSNYSESLKKAHIQINLAATNAKQALVRTKNIIPIKCEAGLAIAAVEQARVRLILIEVDLAEHKDGYLFADGPRKDDISKSVNKAKNALLTVLRDNQMHGQNVRIEATAYLRMAELSLLQKETWHLGRLYYEKFQSIEAKIEHDFLRQWSQDVRNRLKKSNNNNLIVEIEPAWDLTKEGLEKKLYNHINILAINRVALDIEEEAINNNNFDRKKLIPRLKEALRDRGIPEGSTATWIEDYKLVEALKEICPLALEIPLSGKQTSKEKQK